MMHARQFVELASETKTLCYRLGWVPATPLLGTLRMRLRDAWAVLKGVAEAVEFDKPVTRDVIQAAFTEATVSGEKGHRIDL